MTDLQIIRTKTPADLTILRDKVARGDRITQDEALRIQDLEWRLSRDIQRELDGLPPWAGGAA